IMAKLKLNSKAPNFILKDKDSKSHQLRKIKSLYYVIYFYPKDNTSGCTLEAKGFSRDLLKFKRKKIEVIGISGGDEKTKTNFCKKHRLKVKLLSDPTFAVSKKYGCYGKKIFMGRIYYGIFRKTFILDKNQKIIKIYDSVTPESHSKEVLNFISCL